MTLQQLPPAGENRFEFDQDIESGLRPPLFTRDVSDSIVNTYIVATNCLLCLIFTIKLCAELKYKALVHRNSL